MQNAADIHGMLAFARQQENALIMQNTAAFRTHDPYHGPENAAVNGSTGTWMQQDMMVMQTQLQNLMAAKGPGVGNGMMKADSGTTSDLPAHGAMLAAMGRSFERTTGHVTMQRQQQQQQERKPSRTDLQKQQEHMAMLMRNFLVASRTSSDLQARRLGMGSATDKTISGPSSQCIWPREESRANDGARGDGSRSFHADPEARRLFMGSGPDRPSLSSQCIWPQEESRESRANDHAGGDCRRHVPADYCSSTQHHTQLREHASSAADSADPAHCHVHREEYQVQSSLI